MPDVSELLLLDADGARRHLDALGDPTAWTPGFLPGMMLFHVRGGPLLAPAITGFVRVAAGECFPEHEHLGVESVVVLQGSYWDVSGIVRAGDRVTQPAGSRHSFTVRPGPDLLYLAVVESGLRIGDRLLEPGDPEA